MRAKRAPWAILMLIAGLALVVAISVGSAVASPRAAADQTYVDPVGDANGGPDVTGVAVTNDAAGTVNMVVSVALPSGSLMMVTIDSNLDSTADRAVGVYSLGSGIVVAAASTTDPRLAPVSSLRLSATGTTVTLSFAKGDVGIDQTFNFAIGTVQSMDQSDLSDYAGPYQYTLATTPPPVTTPAPTPAPAPAPVVIKPVIGAPVASPAKMVAGKRTTVTFAVTRSDTGQPMTTGKMVCDPSVAGKVVRHAESFKSGKARLSFLVPKGAKGKLLKVKVTIKAGTRSTTRVATYRVG